MPRTARQALAGLLIALHAAISLCGPGLHAAPGLGHIGLSGSVSRPDAHPELSKTTTTTAEHCPLCDYFSQGQLPFQASFVVSVRLVLPFEPVHPSVLFPRLSHLAARSRAPPCGDARIV